MIRYFKSYLDDNKFVHSIDNVIVIYDLKMNYDRVLEKIRSIAECLNCKSYYERLNCSPCVKYSFWVHTINIDSCYICLGKHSEKGVEVGTGNKAWYQVDKMRIEINPNKWHDSDLFKMLMDMVKEVAYEGIIDCIDYAIDVPCNINDVVVLRSRKEYGEYKGTKFITTFPTSFNTCQLIQKARFNHFIINSNHTIFTALTIIFSTFVCNRGSVFNAIIRIRSKHSI